MYDHLVYLKYDLAEVNMNRTKEYFFLSRGIDLQVVEQKIQLKILF